MVRAENTANNTRRRSSAIKQREIAMTAAGGAHKIVTPVERKRRREAAFARLVAAAKANIRCPENYTPDINSTVLGELARAGRIRILISNRNYRTVEILEGPAAGKSTAGDPTRAYAWNVIDKNGTRINGKLQIPKSMAPITLEKINF